MTTKLRKEDGFRDSVVEGPELILSFRMLPAQL